MIENINWYPGHMKKTREMIQENLKMIDLVIEVIDARIPISSRNPIINDIIGGKPRVILLNKMDLADGRENDKWAALYKSEGHYVVPMNCMTGAGLSNLLSLLGKIQEKRNETLGRKRNLRMMIVGVPNVGKSSLINRMIGKKSAKTGDRPGVTRGKQWLTLENGMQLLDTPGILWPKFEDPSVGLNLAFCGSIRDETMDLATLALELIKVLQERYPQLLKERYKLEELGEEGLDTMETIALKRGFILPGKRIDYERTARTVLDEFRSGLIGTITLERCE
ncbi:ribosome biogenesis GTPase YlqF [Clostridium aminobutyricum]|uniref:Ribosome biogenesis GTPase A n=1 Tax=Clostridium aminobutyricum TaxID=33953 RepID=A0A939D6D2_CLOAM|nr:ribosome biogenesis GTPase YlqF [Clostridium aminobutyricum]MBN7771891.1 ribosome biogenesis GTPase YlqF [Clostridium aminobutyricum]